jgi:aminopeptidase
MGMTTQEQHARIAENVLGRSLGVKRGEQVSIRTWDHSLDVAGEFYHEARRRGARALIEVIPAEPYYRSLRELDTKTLKQKQKFGRALAQVADVQVSFAGPRDPEYFRDIPYDKMRADWDQKEAKEIEQVTKRRKVRSTYLSFTQATPERARSYGLDIHGWRESALGALLSAPEEFARAAKPLQERIGKGKEGRIVSGDGSTLTFRLARRPAVLDDGVLRKEDVKRGDSFVHLPAGTVFFAPLEGSFDGRVAHDLPQASRGRWIRGVWFDVKRSKVSAFGAAQLEDELRTQIEAKDVPRLRTTYISVGVNPNAHSGFLDNQMAAGVIGVHGGDNHTFGGKVKDSDASLGGFSARATLEIDGTTLVDKGRLVA